jgi:ferredoxin
MLSTCTLPTPCPDGQVTSAEFFSAARSMHAARAWHRYCPTCIYANTCNFCQECNVVCTMCSANSFCTDHWLEHPGRELHLTGSPAAEEEARQARQLDTISQMRTTLLIQPMTWVYSSSLMNFVPTRQQARLRRAIRAQQKLVEEAQEADTTESNPNPNT